MAVLRQAEADTPVPDLCLAHGVSTATFLQVAGQVRWPGRVVDGEDERVQGREPAT